MPQEETAWSVTTDASDATRQADLAAVKTRIENYTTSDSRPKDRFLKATLDGFLNLLPEDGRTELVADLKNKPGDEGLYAVFSNLLTGLLKPSKF